MASRVDRASLRRQRRLLLARASLWGAAIACVFYACLWFYEAGRVRHLLAATIASEETHGVDIHSDSVRVTGFPLFLSVESSGLAVKQGGDAGLKLMVPVFSARAFLWNTLEWRFSAGQGGSGTLGVHAMQIADASGSVAETETGAVTIHLEGGHPRLARDGKEWIAAKLFVDVRLPPDAASGHEETSLQFDIQFQQASVAAMPPLGPTIADLRVAGDIQGRVPDLPWKAALTSWRDEGGTVEIRQASLHWGGMEADGDGTFALDRAMQPIGAFSADISGYGDVLETLAAAGELKPNDVRFMREGLDLLAQTDASGVRKLRAPVTLQDGGLFLGPARIAKVPDISW